MNVVLEVLRHLGYGELRQEDADEWVPISSADDSYGTTDETHVISRKRDPIARLVDPESGDRVATARLSCPVGQAEGISTLPLSNQTSDDSR